MGKKKRKYYIDAKAVTKLFEQAYGFKVKELNWYTLRLRHPEFHASWDWYHTQGSVVRNEDGRCTSLSEQGDAEDLADSINRYVYNKV